VLRKWKDIKMQQATIQEVTPGEFPQSLNITKLSENEMDPTILDLVVEIMSRRGSPVKIHNLIKYKDSSNPTTLLPQGFIRRG
jgi:hypothetical protein